MIRFTVTSSRSNIYGVLLFCEGLAEGFFQVAAPLP